MGKILLILRVSTDAQDLEEQKREMIEFALSEGYSIDNIICREAKGASAIKINETYLELFNDVKNYVESGQIECVAVWHLNRLARDEEWFIKYKKLLLAHSVQLIVKNPALRLLNPDGSINNGMELAFSLFSTLSKQDMEEKKAKFKRTKKANARKGKYNGGPNIRYGYKVNDDNYYIIDELEGKIVSTIFELYSTGEYSAQTLGEELSKRGYNLDKQKITNILNSDAYCGRVQTRFNERTYPAIVSEELFDKCAKIRDDNKIMLRTGNSLCLSAKLIRCVECGSLFTANVTNYVCCKHNTLHKCGNTLTIKKDVIDSLLWRISSMLHLEFLQNINSNKVEEYKKDIEIIENKINVIDVKLSKIQEKIDRVIELYVEGAINSENKALRLNKIKSETKDMEDERNALKESKNRIYSLIENYSNGGNEIDMLMDALDLLEIDENKMEYRYNIIHKYIVKAVCEREWFGDKRDKRVKKPNGVRINITTINNSIWTFMYVPNAYDGCKLYIWNGHEFLKDSL